jgi:glutamine amidotransferase
MTNPAKFLTEGVLDSTCIQVIDLGICNLMSITNALERVGVRWEKVNTYERLGHECDAIILPGVGAYSAGMDALRSSGIDVRIRDISEKAQLPILGICLGMQLLFDGSDEYGKHAGLGLIPGWVKKLKPMNNEFKVPNVGWCEVEWRDRESVLARPEAESPEAFYFVHSYWCDCERNEDQVGTVDMGFPMAAVVEVGNIMGAQFHPEKSLDAGLDLLLRFARFAANRSR